MFYYYIEGSDDVFEREEEIDSTVYPQFRLVYGKELQYYLAHPGCTRSEIKRAIADEENKPTLADIKARKIKELNDYDSSDAVNGFYIAGNLMWRNPAERDNYLSTLQSAQRLGVQSIPFMGYDITPEMGIMMLDMINLYAMQCVGVTEHHAAVINNFGTIEEVENYDFTTMYPEKLRFMDEPVVDPDGGEEPTPDPDEPVEPEIPEPDELIEPEVPEQEVVPEENDDENME